MGPDCECWGRKGRPCWRREVQGNQTPLRLWSGASRLQAVTGHEWMLWMATSIEKKRERNKEWGRVENIRGTFREARGRVLLSNFCSRWGYLWVCLRECWREYVSVCTWERVCECVYVREKAFGVVSWREVHFLSEVTVRNIWKPYSNPKPERHPHPQLKSCWSPCCQAAHIYWEPTINMCQCRGGSETIESKNGTRVLKELTADLEMEMGWFIINAVDLTRVKVLLTLFH